MSTISTTIGGNKVNVYFHVVPSDGAQTVKVSCPDMDSQFDFKINYDGSVAIPCCNKEEIIIAGEILKRIIS